MTSNVGPCFIRISTRAGDTRIMGSRHARVGQACGERSVFAEWHFNGTSLTVVNDRYGLQPLFYCVHAQGISLSTSIKKLLELGAPTDLDDAAIAVLLRLGFMIGGDTPFKHIRAVPPGAKITWTTDAFQISHSLPETPVRRISRSEAIDRHIELFRAAMRERAGRPGAIGMPLSGGLDSRHILLELLQCGRPPKFCVTARYHPPRATPDAEIAAELSTVFGIVHHVVDQPQLFIATLERHLSMTNWCTITPSSFMLPVADFLKNRADVIFDGIGGDVLCAGLYQSNERVKLFNDGRLSELATDLLDSFNGGGGFKEGTLEKTLNKSARRQFSRALAVDRLAAELTHHTGSANPMMSFAFFNRTRRDIGHLPFSVLSSVSTVLCPYLDDDFIDFMMSLPPEITVDKKFHFDALAKSVPHAPQIRYASWRSADGDGKFYSDLSRQLIKYSRGGLRPSAANHLSVALRLFRCLADRRYAASATWLAPLLVYCTELEALAQKMPLFPLT